MRPFQNCQHRTSHNNVQSQPSFSQAMQGLGLTAAQLQYLCLHRQIPWPAGCQLSAQSLKQARTQVNCLVGSIQEWGQQCEHFGLETNQTLEQVHNTTSVFSGSTSGHLYACKGRSSSQLITVMMLLIPIPVAPSTFQPCSCSH